MHAPRQHQQGRAGGVDDGCLGGLDELRIHCQRVAGAEFLHDGRLGADVPRGLVGAAQFVQRRIVHANGVGIDRRSLEPACHGHDHAGIQSA